MKKCKPFPCIVRSVFFLLMLKEVLYSVVGFAWSGYKIVYFLQIVIYALSAIVSILPMFSKNKYTYFAISIYIFGTFLESRELYLSVISNAFPYDVIFAMQTFVIALFGLMIYLTFFDKKNHV